MKNRLFFRKKALTADGSPAPHPLEYTVERVARFNEVDALGIVWHGHYASYLEDARGAFGNYYGLGYKTMYAAGIVAPVKQMFLDYEAPIRFEQRFRITARLFWSEAARLNFEYELIDLDGTFLARGYTVQLFLTLDGTLLYAKPDFYAALCVKWRDSSSFVVCPPTDCKA